jgi:hypothetical protein
MDNPNFSRKALNYFKKSKSLKGHFVELIQFLKEGQKFLVPKGLLIMDDGLKYLPSFRKLPFPITITEGYVSCTGINAEAADKKLGFKPLITVAVDGDLFGYEREKARIYLLYCPDGHRWEVMPYVMLLDLNQGSGEPTIETEYEVLDDLNILHPEVRDSIMDTSYYAGARTILELLEILSCSNIEASSVKPTRSISSKEMREGVLPFDSYKVLEVTTKYNEETGRSLSGNGRTPREHVRRGHIRRYKTGLQIWINAMVVSVGVGNKVTKDYLIKTR